MGEGSTEAGDDRRGPPVPRLRSRNREAGGAETAVALLASYLFQVPPRHALAKAGDAVSGRRSLLVDPLLHRGLRERRRLLRAEPDLFGSWCLPDAGHDLRRILLGVRLVAGGPGSCRRASLSRTGRFAVGMRLTVPSRRISIVRTAFPGPHRLSAVGPFLHERSQVVRLSDRWC